jgi:hypothetical protein
MIATPRLRFIERKYQMSAFYRDQSGGPAFTTVRVLQQYWASITSPNDVPEGEWRDVPLETDGP